MGETLLSEFTSNSNHCLMCIITGHIRDT